MNFVKSRNGLNEIWKCDRNTKILPTVRVEIQKILIHNMFLCWYQKLGIFITFLLHKQYNTNDFFTSLQSLTVQWAKLTAQVRLFQTGNLKNQKVAYLNIGIFLMFLYYGENFSSFLSFQASLTLPWIETRVTS